MMNNNKNYTIVFNNERKSKHNLQMAGKNVLGEENPRISDYYNNKFKKNQKTMENIDEEEDDDELDHNAENKKVDNFVHSAKKI